MGSILSLLLPDSVARLEHQLFETGFGVCFKLIFPLQRNGRKNVCVGSNENMRSGWLCNDFDEPAMISLGVSCSSGWCQAAWWYI